MTTLREAAQRALEALYDIDATGVPVGHIDLVIDTLREALAKPDDCEYDDCINYDENELCYRWSSGDCPGPRMPKIPQRLKEKL